MIGKVKGAGRERQGERAFIISREMGMGWGKN